MVMWPDIQLTNTFLNDNKKRLNELLYDLCTCDLLVRDDLAKSKHNDFKEDMYFKIINDSSSRNLPICYTSNEDLYIMETLHNEKYGVALQIANKFTGKSPVRMTLMFVNHDANGTIVATDSHRAIRIKNIHGF